MCISGIVCSSAKVFIHSSTSDTVSAPDSENKMRHLVFNSFCSLGCGGLRLRSDLLFEDSSAVVPISPSSTPTILLTHSFFVKKVCIRQHNQNKDHVRSCRRMQSVPDLRVLRVGCADARRSSDVA